MTGREPWNSAIMSSLQTHVICPFWLAEFCDRTIIWTSTWYWQGHQISACPVSHQSAAQERRRKILFYPNCTSSENLDMDNQNHLRVMKVDCRNPVTRPLCKIVKANVRQFDQKDLTSIYQEKWQEIAKLYPRFPAGARITSQSCH